MGAQDSVLLQCCSGVPANLASTPASATRSGSGLGERLTITIDDADRGQFRFENPVSSVNEGDGIAAIWVLREHGSSGDVAVRVRSGTSGTATRGVDYDALNTELLFPDGGATRAKAFIVLLPDDLVEPAETVEIVLEDDLGEVVSSTIVEILDVA